jgi:hypothetical protein
MDAVSQIPLISVDVALDLSGEVERLRTRATRTNTSKAYKTAWDAFVAFCAAARYRSLPAPPRAVAEYLASLRAAGRAVKTCRQHKAAVRHYHLRARHADPGRDPLVDETWRGILIEADKEKPPVSYAVWRAAVERVVDKIDADLSAAGLAPSALTRLAAARDRALILMLASSARPSAGELHSLARESIVSAPDGIDICVRRSPDLVVPPRIVRVRFGRDPHCPVRALDAWLRLIDLERPDAVGPVFRAIDPHGHVARTALQARNMLDIVKLRCAAADIAPNLVTMRSFRAGSIVQGAYDGEDDVTLRESAGVGVDSAPRVATLAAHGRALRKARMTPPTGLDALPVTPEQIVLRGRIR